MAFFSSVAVVAYTNPTLALIGLEDQKIREDLLGTSTLPWIESHYIADHRIGKHTCGAAGDGSSVPLAAQITASPARLLPSQPAAR